LEFTITYSQTFSNIFESLFQYFSNLYNDNFTFTNHFYTVDSIFVANVWIACIPVQYIDWLSQDNWMDWVCLLRRRGLHPTPMYNQSLTCTHFAEPNQDSNMYVFVVCVCVCVCNLFQFLITDWSEISHYCILCCCVPTKVICLALNSLVTNITITWNSTLIQFIVNTHSVYSHKSVFVRAG